MGLIFFKAALPMPQYGIQIYRGGKLRHWPRALELIQYCLGILLGIGRLVERHHPNPIYRGITIMAY